MSLSVRHFVSSLASLAPAGLGMALLGSCNDGQALIPKAGPVQAAPPAASVPAAPQPAAAAMPSGSAQQVDFVVSGQLVQGGWLRGIAPAGTSALSFDGTAVPMAADGSFLIAFDRDAGAGAMLRAQLASGRSVSRPLAITPRAWVIEHIPIGPRPGTPPDPVFLRRRAIEVQQINAARQIGAASDGWRQAFIWPAKGRISGKFGAQRIYPAGPANYHSGTDIAGATGTPFVAPADGVVILAAQSPFTLEGNLLMIDHGMGLNSAFLHASQLLVQTGDHVKQGQVIGRIGMTGRATGPHLHWSIKWRTSRLDPMLLVPPAP